MTEFYCCHEFENSQIVDYKKWLIPDDPKHYGPNDKFHTELDGGIFTANGLYTNEDIYFCPFCGRKLSTL